MHAALESIENLAPAIKTFWFRPEKPVDYVAGQFTELYLPHTNADERGEKRWFTISSSPTETLFSITSKFAATQSSTFKQALLNTPLGTRMQFADPMGDFVLPKDTRIPLVFVAAGIGITPIHSMVKYLRDSRQTRPLKVFYYVHHDDDLVFRKTFDDVDGLLFSPVISHPSRQWSGQTGSLDTTQILTALAASPTALAYISGPEVMVERLQHELQKSGIPGHRLVVDFFHGYRQL